MGEFDIPYSPAWAPGVEPEFQNTFETTEPDFNPPKKIDPFDPAPLLRLFEDFTGEMSVMDNEARAIQVIDDPSNQLAVEMTTQAKKLQQMIDKKHKDLKEPYLAVTRELDGFRKNLSDRLASIQKTINDKIRPYLQKKEQDRLEVVRKAEAKAKAEQERLEKIAQDERDRLAAEARAKAEAEGLDKKEADKAAAEAAAMVEAPPVIVAEAPEETKTVTEAGTAKLKKEWVWEIENFKALPAEAFESRKAEIVKALAPYFNAQVKAGIRNIPGVKIFQQAKLDTRAKR